VTMATRFPAVLLAWLPLAALMAFASACSGGENTAPATSAAAAPADIGARLAQADTRKGKILFLQCRACHSLAAENEAGKLGPPLYGVIGRAAGAAPGFAYSDAITKAGISWTPENLDRWIMRPAEFLPGNKMVFIGIPDPQDRAHVIAYIREQSAATGGSR
jgi:cytochrome c